MFNKILSVDELNIPARLIVEMLEPGMLVFFDGQLGAGKTTLCKEIVGLLGLKSRFCSPTFNYKNNYGKINSITINKKISNCNVFHFDLYRIRGTEELYSLELVESLLEFNNICFVEWPKTLLSCSFFNNKPFVLVKIEYLQEVGLDKESRRIIIEKKVDRKANLFDI